jgi:hypothetical protein
MKIKNTIVLISLMIVALSSRGQGGFSYNSSGKFEVVGIETMDSVKKGELFQRSASFIADISDPNFKVLSVEKDSLNDKISADYQIMIYAQSGVLKKIQGAVSYSLTLEVKDGKYRYSFTDFVYHYYGQNRSYQTVDTGKKKKLEETKASGWQKAWNECKATTASKVQKQIISIKHAMATRKPALPIAAMESKKDDW